MPKRDAVPVLPSPKKKRKKPTPAIVLQRPQRESYSHGKSHGKRGKRNSANIIRTALQEPKRKLAASS